MAGYRLHRRADASTAMLMARSAHIDPLARCRQRRLYEYVTRQCKRTTLSLDIGCYGERMSSERTTRHSAHSPNLELNHFRRPQGKTRCISTVSVGVVMQANAMYGHHVIPEGAGPCQGASPAIPSPDWQHAEAEDQSARREPLQATLTAPLPDPVPVGFDRLERLTRPLGLVVVPGDRDTNAAISQGSRFSTKQPTMT